jgi:CelD/BcsL family acetyltransferase involved in cellulose biosynthesis
MIVSASRDRAFTETTVARTFEDLEALRPLWEGSSWRRVDADPDFFAAFARGSAHVIRPHVVRLEGEGDGPQGLVVARLEDANVSVRVGYKTVYRPRLRLLVVAHGGFAIGDREQLAAEAVRALLGTLRRREADAVLLPALPTESELFRAATSLPSRLARQHLLTPTTHWRLVLPPSYDEFLASRSKKTRENVRVYRNRLLREFGDRLGVEVLSSPQDADRLFDELGELAAKTYQSGLGEGFADTEVKRDLIRLGLERGWYRAYVLTLDGQAVAFWPGYAYGGTFFVGTPGYDPHLAVYSIGTYLLLRVIEDLCSDAEVGTLDFGFGDADYKRRFGSESWNEADVMIFAPTLKGVRVSLTRTAILTAARGARATLDRLGLEARLKRRWRRKLQQDRPPRPPG